MYPLTTTTARLMAHDPWEEVQRKLAAYLGISKPPDEPISYATLVDALGINDALWCCRAEPQYASQWRLFAVWCARQVQHLTTDPRSIDALDVAERHARGAATDDELTAAWVAAWSTAGVEAAIWSAASAAAKDPHVAAEAAAEHALAAAGDAARADARKAQATAVEAQAAYEEAQTAAEDAQAAAFRQLVTTGTLPPVPVASA